MDESISSFEIDSNNSCDAVWCQLGLRNGKTLSVCSFYRPPSASGDILQELAHKIETIQTDYIAMDGDFNLPDLNWSQQPSFPGVSGGIHIEMVKVVNLFTLTQTVIEPTRENHVLNLFFRNATDLMQSTRVIPGIIDHQGVICDTN